MATIAFRDATRPISERIEDLLAQMTVEEKAGLMFHPPISMTPEGELIESGEGLSRGGATELVAGRHLNHFNIYYAPEPRLHAEWHNRLQELAVGTRLGIPVTISSDPRHSFEALGASWSAGGFSQWPEPIGLGATGDPELVRRFARHRAAGVPRGRDPRRAPPDGRPRHRAALGAVDAARSARTPSSPSRLVAAYIRGFQGDELGPHSVACMTKHFPGGGPQRDGEDPHFHYGKDQVYPGGNFEYHLEPFEAAFAAGTAQIMPYYGRPVGTGLEEVGFGFNRDVITGILRERYGFDGVVCTDWGLVTDYDFGGGDTFPAKAWGVEELSAGERLLKIVDAGCDQLGGEALPELLVELVHSRRVSEERLDVSCRRLLRDKFRLGLFDDPFVDPDEAERVCGRAEFRAAGEEAQRRAIVLLRNDGRLPLQGRPRLFVDGLSAEAAARYGEVVGEPEDAEVAIAFRNAPFEPRTSGYIESRFHAGDLDFKGEELARLLALARRVPTILVVHLERPAVMPELAAACAGLLGSFGAADEAILDVVFGRFAPTGRLPFELASSMDAVRRQLPDVPYDSEAPLFPFGFGLSYGS